ncbi:MAG: succinate dehydrogenase assembly factor 2 [Candidatus Methylopumilus sp.]|jgi:antitoxin CptB
METSTRRMVWRCRRGLLELDLLLGKFVVQDFAAMTTAQLQILDKLLDFPDNELLDLVTDRVQTADADTREMLQLIRGLQEKR